MALPPGFRPTLSPIQVRNFQRIQDENPDKINDGTFKMLYQLNVISLGFWYGERALKNLGLNIGGLRKK